MLWIDTRAESPGPFPWCSVSLVTVFCVLTSRELGDLLARCGLLPAGRAVPAATILFLAGKLALLGGFVPGGATAVTLWTGVVLVGCALALVLARDPPSGARHLGGAAVAAWFLLGLSFLLDLAAAFGATTLFSVVLATKAGDIGGYLVGRFLGRRKLIPRVSPGKTVEGTAGGYALSAAAAAFLFTSVSEIQLGIALALGLGLLLNTAGLLGDLQESLLKRAAGVKDSGRILPEFGGAFDMVDSLVLAAPLGWACLSLVPSA